MTTNVHVRIRFEDHAYWATVDEYPGVFAAGDTLDELHESLEEGLSLVIRGADPQLRPVRLVPLAVEAGDRLEGGDSVAESELSLD